MSLRLLLALGLTFVLSCGDDGTGDDDDDDDDNMVDIDAGNPGDPDAFVPPGDSFTVDWGPLTINPGEEDTKCVVKRLGNPADFKAHQIHNVLGGVSHHMIVYRSPDTAEQTTPFGCTPFTDLLNPAGGTTPLMISQRNEDTLTLPEGVAFVLEEDQMIRLELHYINTSDSPIEAHPTSTFIPIEDGAFTDAADLLFMGDVNISVPAGGTATLGPTFVPAPAALNGVNYFAMTGHEHQWGTGVVVESAGPGGGSPTVVYDVTNFDWDEPETVDFNPALNIPDNGGFRITCEWNNQSGSTATFGEGANDEMCFFWTYYYPSEGPRICFAHSGFGLTGCCPGHALCGSF